MYATPWNEWRGSQGQKTEARRARSHARRTKATSGRQSIVITSTHGVFLSPPPFFSPDFFCRFFFVMTCLDHHLENSHSDSSWNFISHFPYQFLAGDFNCNVRKSPVIILCDFLYPFDYWITMPSEGLRTQDPVGETIIGRAIIKDMGENQRGIREESVRNQSIYCNFILVKRTLSSRTLISV